MIPLHHPELEVVDLTGQCSHWPILIRDTTRGNVILVCRNWIAARALLLRSGFKPRTGRGECWYPVHKPSSDGRFPESDDKAERALFDALCEAGWIIPQTLEDVRRAEAEFADHAVSLPPELRDSDAVFHGANRSQTEAQVTNKAASIEAERNLARAAREGGQIPPEAT